MTTTDERPGAPVAAADAAAVDELRLPKSDPELRFETIRGSRLAFTDEGPNDAPALIAVHGVPGSVRDFRYLAPQLTPFARFVRVDLPGSGGSEPRRDALRNLTERARTILELADRLSLRAIGVVGHSMGGGTAIVTAAEGLGRVTSLTLIAPMGLRRHRGLSLPPRTFRRYATMLRTPVVRAMLLPTVRAQYRRMKFPKYETMTALDFAIQFDAFSAADFDLVNRACAALSPPPRTVVAYTADDHLVEEAIPRELAAAISGARALRFESGGHIIQKTRAVEIGAAIRELLA